MKNKLFIMRIMMLILTIIGQLTHCKKTDVMLHEKCTVDYHGITRALPTAFLRQFDYFRKANTENILLKSRPYIQNMLLLYGPQGAGKSTIAEMFWKEIPGAKPIRINTSDLTPTNGVHEIRRVFEEAKTAQNPTVIIIKDIDRIASVSTLKSNENGNYNPVYMELNDQLKSIRRNHCIFVIGTSNGAHEYNDEFWWHFEHVKIDHLSDHERFNALKTLFLTSEVVDLDTKEIENILQQLAQKLPGEAQQEVDTLMQNILNLDTFFKQLRTDSFDKVAHEKIQHEIAVIREAISICKQQYPQLLETMKRETEALEFTVKTMELKLNIYYLVTKSDWIIKKLVKQTANCSWAFMKRLVDDVLLHAFYYDNNTISIDLILSRLKERKLCVIHNSDKSKTNHEEWQDEMLRLHRAMLLSQLTIQGIGTAGHLAIQGAIHGPGLIETVKAHPYITAALGIIAATGPVIDIINDRRDAKAKKDNDCTPLSSDTEICGASTPDHNDAA
ncbi:ATP-binding protein [Candidatus Dependentiae bacterium]|nr:ATP-binding protein [Candidatus Dependentiae bacterium]